MQILEIATIGKDANELTRTLRKVPFTKLVLLHEKGNRDAAEEVANLADVLGGQVDLKSLDAATFPTILSTVTEVCAREGPRFDRVISNASAGEPPLCCGMTIAALANGIEAVMVSDEDVHHLPLVAVPFWRLVTGAKERILGALVDAGGHLDTLSDLARTAGVESSVLHYHLRDPAHGRGLVDMGLVEVERQGNHASARILPFGVVAVLHRRAEARHATGGARPNGHNGTRDGDDVGLDAMLRLGRDLAEGTGTQWPHF